LHSRKHTLRNSFNFLVIRHGAFIFIIFPFIQSRASPNIKIGIPSLLEFSDMLNEIEEVSVQLGPSKSAQLLSKSDSEDEGKESELDSD
jgi:hypothetical protein